jgi:hypothetical protein
MSIQLILRVFAIVFLLLAAVNVPGHPRFNFGWAGMFCWLASTIAW